MAKQGKKGSRPKKKDGPSGSSVNDNTNNNNNNNNENGGNNNEEVVHHPLVFGLLQANENVLQRLAKTATVLEKLQTDHAEMTGIVQSTRNGLIQLDKSFQQRHEALEKANAKLQSERDVAVNKKEAQLQDELQLLRAQVASLEHEKAMNSSNIGEAAAQAQEVDTRMPHAEIQPLSTAGKQQQQHPSKVMNTNKKKSPTGVMVSSLDARRITHPPEPFAGHSGGAFQPIIAGTRNEQIILSIPKPQSLQETQTATNNEPTVKPPSQQLQIQDPLVDPESRAAKNIAEIAVPPASTTFTAELLPIRTTEDDGNAKKPAAVEIMAVAKKPPPPPPLPAASSSQSKVMTVAVRPFIPSPFLSTAASESKAGKKPVPPLAVAAAAAASSQSSKMNVAARPFSPSYLSEDGSTDESKTGKGQVALENKGPKQSLPAAPSNSAASASKSQNSATLPTIDNEEEQPAAVLDGEKSPTLPPLPDILNGETHDTLTDQSGLLSIASSRQSSRMVPSDTRLSLYLYPKRNRAQDSEKETGISPIFNLLQTQSTLETARALLKCEGEMWVRKRALRELEKKKKAVENTIHKEKQEDNRYATEIKKLQKERSALLESQGSWNILKGWWDKDSDGEDDDVGGEQDDDIDDDEEAPGLTDAQRARKAREKVKQMEGRKKRAAMSRAAKAVRMKKILKEIEKKEKAKSEIPGRISTLTTRVAQWGRAIDSKMLLISELRAKFGDLKGEGGQEEENFDMNNSRDENGHTFLMVAAQNNDVDTAQLCLDLLADPNARSAEGHTAMVFSYYFGFDAMTALIARKGGTYPGKLMESWNIVDRSMSLGENPVDWDIMLRIAQQAAIPTDSVLGSAKALEASEESRMAVLPKEERNRPALFFDASLLDPTSNVLRRIVLLEETVYNWYFGIASSEKLAFVTFLDQLRNRHATYQCHRRAVVGMKNPYEILCAPLEASSSSPVCLFTPFVASVVDGVVDVGILVWAVTTDDQASLFKTLIESTEFLRHKEDREEAFPLSMDGVLKFGVDMDLLDLKSTSILTSKPMDLYIVDLDDGDLDRLREDKYAPRKRVTHFERHLRQAVFQSTQAETEDGQEILSAEHHLGRSTSLQGGAGTGKTLLMIKKVISEPSEKRILVVSRLPRLVSEMRRAVSAEREVQNVTFSTYNDLLALLAREVKPTDEAEYRRFSALTQIHFGDTTGTGLSSAMSFDDFIRNCLEENERKVMRAKSVEPITLWTAFRDIKSNVQCSVSKRPLNRQEYLDLPTSFGLRYDQRELVYDLFLQYEQWRKSGGAKWDEADRVIYILKWGPSVFADPEFVSWEERAYKRGEVELLEADGDSPLTPFFYNMVVADEAQDFTELDLALFLRMSGGLDSLFLGADPGQSVELGVRMRGATIHDVFHASLPADRKGNAQVKHVLQEIKMRRNHRTHAQNLNIANKLRRMMARSFGLPWVSEVALINGPIPEMLSLAKISDLADTATFIGGNIVFVVPDEIADKVRSEFCRHNVSNDVYGVREIKGLEFEEVALLGFFSHIDHLGNEQEWENSLRWLGSKAGITTTSSSEKIRGRQLEDCDFRLSHPEVLDQAMMLYTAMTRARKHLYIIEVAEYGKKQKGGKRGLQDSAFRQLLELGLAKSVKSIDEGFVEMTPQQHKVRGALLMTHAITLDRNGTNTPKVKETFAMAADHFRPDKGNEKDLLVQCEKHSQAILLKRKLKSTMEKKFLNSSTGAYDLQGRFNDVLTFEGACSEFFGLCIGDSFLVDDVSEMRALVEELFQDTPYETRFGEICRKIKRHERS